MVQVASLSFTLHNIMVFTSSLSTIGNIPALCCAPNQSVAECLEQILQAMLGQRGVPL